EIDKHVATLLFPEFDACRPFRQRLRLIIAFVSTIRAMTANIDKISGAFLGRRRVMMVGYKKRDISLRQKFEDPRLIPARMPKFETVASLLRNLKNDARRSASFSKFGGRRNNTGPALSPKSDSRSSIKARLLSELFESRFQC